MTDSGGMFPSPLQHQALARAPPRRSRNSTRDREKAELQALRRLALELEARVAVLKLPQHGRPQKMASVWKRVAKRQAGAKHEEQRKNRELMGRVQRNADWIQRLWELLRETRSAQPHRTDRDLATRHASKYADSIVFERLKLDAQVAALHSLQVFAAQGVSVLSDGLLREDEDEDEDVDRWSHVGDKETGTSRFVCVRRVPFDAHAASEAMWSALTGMTSASTAGVSECNGDDVHPASSNLRILERSQDVCAMKYQLDGHFGSVKADTTPVYVHAIAQKLAGGEENGTKLFVWRSVSTLDTSGDDSEVVHSNSSDIMWVAVTSAGLNSTIAIVAQALVEAEGGDTNCIAQFQETMMAGVEMCVNEILLGAENMLVDGEMAHRSPRDDATAYGIAV
ncbi:hypothetical protein BBJ28_00000260 [Nothophytophthora sp. Chile5]|nr:hypothetical protein BBJ28_00000260 [Nothophytophthora sp. Chile5]